MSPSCAMINSASRVELSSGPGLEILGTLAFAVLFLVALWISEISETVDQILLEMSVVRTNEEKEQNMGNNNRSRFIVALENVGTGVIGSSLLMLNS